MAIGFRVRAWGSGFRGFGFRGFGCWVKVLNSRGEKGQVLRYGLRPQHATRFRVGLGFRDYKVTREFNGT